MFWLAGVAFHSARRRERSDGCSSLLFLGCSGGNKVVFDNEDFSRYGLKKSFVFLIHSWTSLCVKCESPFVCNVVNLVRV